MNGEVVIENKRKPCGARAFPEKANPNRPALGRMQEPPPHTPPTRGGRAPGEAGTYPEKCNPRGRRSPLTEDQRRLVERYLPLAKSMARKMNPPRLDLDELISAAYLALVEAAESFDPAYTVNFATFARIRIHGALSDCRRNWYRLAIDSDGIHSPEFRRLRHREEIIGWFVGKPVESPHEAEFEQTEALESYFRRLPREQAKACRLIYIDGKTQAEAADLLGYSRAYLSRLHQNALDSLRRDHEFEVASGDQARGASGN